VYGTSGGSVDRKIVTNNTGPCLDAVIASQFASFFWEGVLWCAQIITESKILQEMWNTDVVFLKFSMKQFQSSHSDAGSSYVLILNVESNSV